MMQENDIIEVDVLVVGLSISGIALVKELSDSEVSFLGVEKSSGLYEASKAAGLRPEVLPTFEKWKLTEQVRSNATKLVGKKITHNGKVTDISYISDKNLSISQYMVEKVILGSITKKDNLFWSTTMIEWTTKKDGSLEVKCVDARGSEGKEFTVHCKYMFACDGTNSMIRQKCHLKTDISDISSLCACFDVNSNHTWFNEIDNQYVYVVSREDKKYRIVLCPLGENGWWKIYMAFVTPNQKADTKQLLAEVRRRSGLELNEKDCHNLSFYKTQTSICEAFHNKDGNVFLVGDSAHTYKPFGGYGLNEAITDAVEFAKVLKEGGDELGQCLVNKAIERKERALEVIELVKEDKVSYKLK